MANLFQKIFFAQKLEILSAYHLQVCAPSVEEYTSDTFVLPNYGYDILSGTELPILGYVESFDIQFNGSITQYQLLHPAEFEEYKPSEYLLVTDNTNAKSKCPDQKSLMLELFTSNDSLTSPEVIKIPIEYLDQSSKIDVSRNLFIPMEQPDKVIGMDYAERHWKVEKLPSFNKPITKKNDKQEKKDILPRKVNSVKNSNAQKAKLRVSIWDIIFVLLQPPLAYDKSDSLFLPFNLYPYQVTGVDFLISNQHALLADDMGTGKTVMTITALKVLFQQNKIKQALILCPPSVLSEWEKHLDLWSPELVTCFIRGNPEIRKCNWNAPAHVYITTYDTLRSDIENKLLPSYSMNRFEIVIIDEAHHLKNANSKRSRAIRRLDPIYRWALTGTPIQNKIEDLASLFDFIYPDYLNSFDLEPERIVKKVKPHFLRRTKKEVLPDLPPKILQEYWLEMTPSQRSAYEKVEREIQCEFTEMQSTGKTITKQHVFAKIQRLKQICNFPPGEGRSPKLDLLKEQIEEITGSDNKAIVFTQYIQEGIDKLSSSLAPYGIATIKGGQSDSERRCEIDRFLEKEDTRVMIASVKSGGEGLNLTAASYVIHFDHWWNPAVMWQAEDRVHRRGQENKVNVYSYWMEDSIDSRINEILRNKGILISQVIDGMAEEGIEELFTMDDLLQIVGVKNIEIPKSKFSAKGWVSYSLEEIRDHLYEIKPGEFEELTKQLLEYFGYRNAKVTKITGDGGIDVISSKITEKGIEKIAAQCKRYKKPVGVPIAREFYGAIHDDKSITKGYLITTGEFTSECIDYCIRNGIEFLNGLQVADYVKKFGLSVN